MGSGADPTSLSRKRRSRLGGGKNWRSKRLGCIPAVVCPSGRVRAMPASGSELQRLPQERDAKSRPHGELQYLEQIEHILRCGFHKADRTGTGTLSIFGLQARYSLRGDGGRTRGGGGSPPGGLGAAAEESARERLGARLTFSPNLNPERLGKHPYPHFTDAKAAARSRELICVGSHEQE